MHISVGNATQMLKQCVHILEKWSLLKNKILSKKTKHNVTFTQFVKKPHTAKKGKEIMRLEQPNIFWISLNHD